MEIVDLIRIIGLTKNCSSTTGKLVGNNKPYQKFKNKGKIVIMDDKKILLKRKINYTQIF